MNKALIDVYLAVRKPRWGKGLAGKTSAQRKDIEEIILGDVEARDRQRDQYLTDEMEEQIDKIIAE